MHRLMVICVVTSVTLLGSNAGRAHAIDSRCDALQELVPATIGAITGDLTGAARHARQLRDLSTRELVPRQVKPALRRLARFFERAPELSLTERAEALGDIARPLSKLVLYATEVCTDFPSPSSTGSSTSTTRPLR